MEDIFQTIAQEALGGSEDIFNLSTDAEDVVEEITRTFANIFDFTEWVNAMRDMGFVIRIISVTLIGGTAIGVTLAITKKGRRAAA